MKKIIVFENEILLDQVKNSYRGSLDIFILNSNVQKELLKLVIKEKADAGIFIDKDYKINLVHKKLGGWSAVDNFTLDLLVMEDLDIKPSTPSYISNRIPFGKKSDLLKFSGNGIKYDESIKLSSLIKKLEILENNNFYEVIKDFNLRNGYFKISNKTINKSDALAFELFKKNILNKVSINDLEEITNVVNDDSLSFNIKTSSVVINEEGDTINLEIFTHDTNEEEFHYSHKNLETYINNYICNIKESMRVIKKSEIALSIFGFILFIILTAVTFTKILNPQDVSKSFEILFDPKTLHTGWIYMLWINFVFSYLFSFIMVFVIAWEVEGERPSSKTLWTYFVAAQLSATARFITGEEIIATVLWGWYIVSRSEVRTSKLVAAVASTSLLSSIFVFAFGVIFMSIGQSYAINVLDYVEPLNNGSANMILFYILSWGGLIWLVFDRIMRFALVYMPPVHYVYNKIYTRVALIKKDNDVFNSMVNREMSLKSLKGSTKKIFESNSRIFRISMIILITTILEAFELMCTFNIVENFNDSQIRHYNFVQLSGARFMITQIKHFPGINILPGSGMGVNEYFMSQSYQAMYIFSHRSIDSINEINVSDAESFAVQTTFIIRFFNVYLMRILSLIVTITVISKTILKRRT